jgi:DNA-binding NarL/FixJ family response regulator
LLAQGHSAKDIAVQWDLSIKTIEAKHQRLLKKLTISSLAQLIPYTIAKEILPKHVSYKATVASD